MTGYVGNFEFNNGIALVGVLHRRVFNFRTIGPHLGIDSNGAPSTVSRLCVNGWYNGCRHAQKVKDEEARYPSLHSCANRFPPINRAEVVGFDP